MNSFKVYFACAALIAAAGVIVPARSTGQTPPPAGQSGPPPGGPGGFGGPGRGGGQFGGARGFRAPKPGTVLPDFVQTQLKLTDTQKLQLAKLQKDVDDKLGKILNADQKKQLAQMGNRPQRGFGGPGRGFRGPGGGGPGGPGGAGGPGGQGGPPPPQ